MMLSDAGLETQVEVGEACIMFCLMSEKEVRKYCVVWVVGL